MTTSRSPTTSPSRPRLTPEFRKGIHLSPRRPSSRRPRRSGNYQGDGRRQFDHQAEREQGGTAAVLNQATTTAENSDPTTTGSRVEVVAVRSDGRWLVDSLRPVSINATGPFTEAREYVMVDTTSTFKDTAPAELPATLHILSANPGKRRTEIIYLIWFLCTVLIQGAVVFNLSYDHANDVLIGQSLVMGVGTLVLLVIFRHPSDRGLPITELYGFRFGIFLTIFAMLGGFIGTDPWYEVLHGHSRSTPRSTQRGATVHAVYDDQRVRVLFGDPGLPVPCHHRAAVPQNTTLSADSIWRHAVLCIILAPLMPLVETFASRRSAAAELLLRQRRRHVGLNVLIYGSWHLASLLFYTRWDTAPGERTPLQTIVVSAFATIGVLMVLMVSTKVFVAPHFVEVSHGVRMLNDWSPDNCPRTQA